VTLRIGGGPSLSVNGPDDETIRWLVRAAQRFGGRVRGDEGEYHDQT